MELYGDDKLGENLTKFHELESNIVQHPIWKSSNPNEGKVENIVKELNKLKQSVEERSEQLNEICHQLTTREIELLNMLEETKREIENIKKSKTEKENELNIKEAEFEEKKQILEEFLNKYVNLSQIDTKIEIENDLLIATIILVPTAPDYIVRFKISPSGNNIIGVDASSILTPRQEEKFLEIFENFDNITGLICTLRQIILMKSSNNVSNSTVSMSSSSSSM